MTLILVVMCAAACGNRQTGSPLAPTLLAADETSNTNVVLAIGADAAAPASEPDETEDAEDENVGDAIEPGDTSDQEFGSATSTGLSMLPAKTTMASGEKRQFSVSGLKAKSTIVWEATGGKVSTKGLFTAGTTPGTFTIRATTSQQGAVTARVTVRVPPVTQTGVPIEPGESIQRAVDAHPAGTRFLIKRGIHRRQEVKPKDGMTFVGEGGAVLDGEGATPRAFFGQLVNRVTIRGLRVTNYVPPNTMAAVDAIDSTGWVVEDNEIDHNSNGSQRAYGLRLGDQMVVRGNSIHHNGWLGINGYDADGVLIERNDIYANPPAAFRDTLGEAANIKLYQCGTITFRNNFVHDGPMIGVWFDTMKPDNTISDNRVINHGGAGIWFELSYRGTISGNRVENAGGSGTYSIDWLHSGGIQVTNSANVSVLNNTVTGSLNGIIAHQAAGYPPGGYGAGELRNLLVQGNTVVMERGQTGIAQNIGSTAVYDSWNNRFNGNRFVVSGNPRPFFWRGRGMTDTEWKAGPGAGDTVVR